MPKTTALQVKNLEIDLENFRTIPQKNETEAIKAMISISPDYFWGLMESLLDDGYLPTENIIILEAGGRFHVKEGNRRIASLKIILGLIDNPEFNLPQKIIERIKGLESEWKKQNSSVSCAIYKESETDTVDRIVTHTHGKGQKAGRDDWEAVARARHNKIKNGASEPSLDLLEKYLEHGKNLTQEQKSRWAGRYNLSVLDEAIKKVAARFSVSSSPELAKTYPQIPHKMVLDQIIHAIGMESLTFPAIRDSVDFALRYGLPPLTSLSGQDPSASSTESAGSNSKSASDSNSGNTGTGTNNEATSTVPGGTTDGSPAAKPTGSASVAASTATAKTTATATHDERSVKKLLRRLKIFGPNRSKIETLRKEAIKLKLKDNPIAFCFLLRSLFETSAKAYCQDHASEPNAPTATKTDGNDKQLAEILREILNHLTQNKSDRQMLKLLHGPATEIQRQDGILSITSMNQLVHNPSFTIAYADIPTLFSNVFPLLEQMNK
ncbi:hypothetical protein BH10PSE18_BH10PSE18_40720 [soil metagenome]